MNAIYERFQLFLAGGMAGGIGVTTVYPIDLVKTRMQNQRSGCRVKYKSSLDCFQKIIKTEGVLGLYRGLRPQLLGVAPEKAIKLAVNDIIKSLYQDKILTSNQTLGLNILSGSLAGLSQVIITNPLEITKIRLQVHGEMNPNKPLSLFTVVNELGIRGLYKGSRACMMRDVPFSAIYFPVYTYLRSGFENDGEISGTNQILVGSIAGVAAAGTTTPMDVVKTRLQVKTVPGELTYNGIIDCYQKIIKHEGPKSLFKGIIPRVLRSSPQFGVTLYFYEMFKKRLQD